jgi:hypothetical protein
LISVGIGKGTSELELSPKANFQVLAFHILRPRLRLSSQWQTQCQGQSKERFEPAENKSAYVSCAELPWPAGGTASAFSTPISSPTYQGSINNY